ncbi:MAG: hypothetical protein R6W99_03820 [Clostridia bacterium]
MKKILVLILILSILAFAVAGCSTKGGESVKTGLAVLTSVAKSKDAGEAAGLAQADSVIVAVTVDNDGVIQNCVIDTVQTKINFAADGTVTTALNTVFAGKQELGEGYGMKKASAIGKEWHEQANALAEYVKGKTVEQVKGIAVNEEGVPTDADLTSSVTVHITDYVAAIEKAVANAKSLGANAGDKIGIGVTSTVDKSKAATADKAGLAQAYANITVVTVDKSGVITSCIIDAVQGNVNFDAQGKITTDLATRPKTKNELGDGYGMKASSGIGKEWYEQAAAFAKYVTGKNLGEVKGIAMSAEGVPTDSELTSSVTVHAGPFVSIIEKAIGSAR